MVICLERGADLHTAQLMKMPLIISCFKIQTGFSFLVPTDPGIPGKRAVKRVCVCRQLSHAGLISDTQAHRDSGIQDAWSVPLSRLVPHSHWCEWLMHRDQSAAISVPDIENHSETLKLDVICNIIISGWKTPFTAGNSDTANDVNDAVFVQK